MEKSLFSDLEGLRIAIEIESRGQEFYRQAYEKVTDEAQKAALLKLKNEEIVHMKTFTDALEKLSAEKGADADEYLFDPDSSRYLSALAEDHVFPKHGETAAVLAGLTSMKDILRLAVQAEKDSILFYDELAARSKFPSAQKIFLALKAEEQRHVVKLRAMLAGR